MSSVIAHRRFIAFMAIAASQPAVLPMTLAEHRHAMFNADDGLGTPVSAAPAARYRT